MDKRIAEWIYFKLVSMKNVPADIIYNKKVYEDLQILNPVVNVRKKQKEYVISKLSLCMKIVFAGVLITILLLIKSESEGSIEDNRLMRNSYGEGADTVELVAQREGESYSIKLDIEQKGYTRQELMDMLDEFIAGLAAAVLGENSSLDRIEYDLKLVDSIQGYPFCVSWYTDEEYMLSNGKLISNSLNRPVMTQICAKIEAVDSDGEGFEAEHTFEVQIFQRAVKTEYSETVAKKLAEVEKSQRDKEFVELPSEIDGDKISWSYKKSYPYIMTILGIPIVIIVIYYSKDRDLHKEVAERNEQMLQDYPEIVSKLSLLIGAGLNVTNAWYKVVNDYRSEHSNSDISRDKNAVRETPKKRYAYEEMLITVYEMENGITKNKAFENFGKRCRIACYTRLSTMIVQNLVKGSGDLSLLLRDEAREAFEERKHSARKLGEKAGTKLLTPMMMILAMMMAVIMIPAFLNFI